ncbi:MAG: S8 family serine peptidase, partial [Bacteroidetes bacterium]|nr:S8 family serine peptidase [Bacteroidota bacterium]
MNKLYFLLVFVFCFSLSHSQSEENGIEINGHRRSLNENRGKIDFIPSTIQLLDIKDKGVTLVSYLGQNTYISKIDAAKSNKFSCNFIRSIDSLNIQDKISYMILSDQDQNTTYEVVASFSVGENIDLIKIDLLRLNLPLAFEHLNKSIKGRLTLAQINILASLPYIYFIEPTREIVAYNRPGNTAGRVNYLNSSIGGLRNLNGQGMTAGVGDGGFVTPHKDLGTRVINTNLSVVSGFGNHGDHVTGTVGGNGNISTSGAAMAPMATILTAQVTDILDSTPAFFNQYQMVETSNSYGNSWTTCAASGVYSAYANATDLQLRDYPKVLHFFASSNDGAQTCSPYPSGFGNLASDFNIAKNVVTIGNVDITDALVSSSSRGPSKDGRIKPDVCDLGNSVFSTVPTNTYAAKTGTSMATPAAVGSALLLYQRYKQLHADSLPDGELIKTVLMNTSDDIGNAGPDFQTGYGRINLRRSLDIIEQNKYIYAQINNGDSQSYTLSIPSGLSKVKIMLGWRDKEASPSASKSLVNDLDFEVRDASNNLYRPWILDTTKANVNNAATRGVDFLNNHEQVTIDNPTSGNYMLKVKGTSIPYPSQDYYITYEFLAPMAKVTYPIGGEKLVSTFTEAIRWDANGVTSGTWSLFYSSDSGTTWNSIITNLSANVRSYNWSVPSITSNKC